MTSATDIKTGGGKCEKVSTDFWECTDKEGKVWWCSNGGKDCQPKPRIGGNLSWLTALAQEGLKLAVALPDDKTGQGNFGADEAAFLSALRNLAADLSTAPEWTEAEARDRFAAFALADATINLALKSPEPRGRKTARSAARDSGGFWGSDCGKEFEQCKDDCANDDEGYPCYVWCRLEYYKCLAGGVIGSNLGGRRIIF
jgi:hypothetical protein